jgi:hypothetical protein
MAFLTAREKVGVVVRYRCSALDSRLPIIPVIAGAP